MEFLKLPLGAPGMAMSEAYGAEPTLEACIVNPSLLPGYRGIGLQATQEQWIGDIRHHAVMAGWEWGRDGGFGALFTYTDFGLQRFTFDGSGPGSYVLGDEFRNDAALLQMGYGQRVGDFVRVGAAAKFAQENIARVQSAALAFDASLGWVDRSEWSYVLSARNLGSPTAYDLHETYPLPAQIRAALSRVFRWKMEWPEYNALKLAADGTYYTADERKFAFGAEYQLGIPGEFMAALRAGYARKSNVTALANFTFGGGWLAFYDQYKFNLDYAYAPFDDFGGTHFFTLGASFSDTAYLFPEPEILKPVF